MKTKRKLRALALILSTLLTLVLFTACSASSTTQETRAVETTVAYAQEAKEMPKGQSTIADQDAVTTTAYNNTDNNSGLPSPITVAPPDSIRKIVSTVNAELLVSNVQDVVQRLKQATEVLGGYVALSSISENGKYYYASMSLRIPSARVESFTNSLADYGKITEQNSSTDDITDSYYDIAARLKNAKTQEGKLIEIMNQANSVEDLLRVRTELDQVQERIEQFQGKLKMWDQLTAYSTVNLNISAEAKFTSVEEAVDKPLSLAELWTSIKQGFSSSLDAVANFFSGLFIGLSYAIIPLLLLAVFAFIIFLTVRAIIKRQAKKRPAQTNTMQVPHEPTPPTPPTPHTAP